MSINAQTERLDHLGVIAGVIKDLGLIEFIDSRIPQVIAEKESAVGRLPLSV